MQLFRDELDMTVHDFVLQSRMRHAQKLLVSSEIPIGEIPDLVGYRDLSGFGRAFKNRYGTTPSKMRAQVVKLDEE